MGKWKAQSFFILAVITGVVCVYDYMQYQKVMIILNSNCDSALELILWNDECMLLYENSNNLQLEMLVIGAITLILAIAGMFRIGKDDEIDAYNINDKGWPWWIILIVPPIILIGVFVAAVFLPI